MLRLWLVGRAATGSSQVSLQCRTALLLPVLQQALSVRLEPEPEYIVGRIIHPDGQPTDAGIIVHVQAIVKGQVLKEGAVCFHLDQ